MKYILILIVWFLHITSYPQTNSRRPPTIGRTFTDFVLDSVNNYSKNTLSYKDFKGKWVILDFWGEGCSGCIASFPKINKLQKEFAKNIQFVLVTQTYQNATQNPNTAISLFKKLQSKFDLTIPASFDQDFVNRVGPAGLPTIIIINPKGIVEAITYTISETDVNDYLAGKKPLLPRNYLLNEGYPFKNYNRDVPLLLYDNGDDEKNYLARSILTKWKFTMPAKDLVFDKGRLEAFEFDLKRLFRLAYIGADRWIADTSFYGKYYYYPVLEVKDSSLFDADYDANKNLFAYSLTCPGDTTSTGKGIHGTQVLNPRFMKILQHDLENYFHFTAHIETRKVPCYRIVATERGKANLITKQSETKFKKFNGGKSITSTNVPIKVLMNSLYGSSKSPEQTIPLIDETGIKENIDLNIDAIYFDDWVKELQKLGIDVIPGEKEMKVLVITDATW